MNFKKAVNNASVVLSGVIFLLAACTNTPATPIRIPTYDPFLSTNFLTPSPGAQTTAIGFTPVATRTYAPTPTLVPLIVNLPPTRDPSQPISSPTPDPIKSLPTAVNETTDYYVEQGDTIGRIAGQFGVSPESILEANGITDANLLEVGQLLKIPPPEVSQENIGDFKIIPDSELVYGPASAKFDINGFIQTKAGFLASYTDTVDGDTLTGAQIVKRVAQDYSVNPRLLLALLEYRSGWVNSQNPSEVDYPFGYVDERRVGLYHQLAWAANELNRGYYLWKVNAVSSFVIGDGTVVPANSTVNAGTVAVQRFLGLLNDSEKWKKDISAFGFFKTYYFLFGNPFDLAIEPLIPYGLTQPTMQLPFEPLDVWSFTGGPHGGWDSGSAWAALDFGPPGLAGGCSISDIWETAATNGYIVRAENGAVIQDLDGDGYEQTGWDILYMHVSQVGRVKAGTFVYAGDRIGHASCEGGISNASHLHMARKYNGEWIPADGTLPFVMDGWVSSGDGKEYDGFLTKGSQTVEAWDGRNDLNQISR